MKIAWAFNPFDDNRRVQTRAVALLKALRGRRDALDVVYVASPNEARLATAFEIPIAERFDTYPRRQIATALRRLSVAPATITVLSQRRGSLTASARTLAAHLARSKCDLTLIASHARKGIPRLLLGSFAETLVHLATTNLLLFNAERRLAAAPKGLLLAHDLSAPADRGLRAAMRYAKAWGCAVHVIHVPDPAYRFTFDRTDVRVEAFRRGVRVRLARIEAQLLRAGVRGSVVAAPSWHPVPDLILEHAHRVRADMLVVVAKAGRLATLMGGSVTRQLLRASTLPVLVVKR